MLGLHKITGALTAADLTVFHFTFSSIEAPITRSPNTARLFLLIFFTNGIGIHPDHPILDLGLCARREQVQTRPIMSKHAAVQKSQLKTAPKFASKKVPKKIPNNVNC